MQIRLAPLTALALLIAGCNGGPQQLASTLDSALKAGDMDAAQALFDRRSLPFEQSIYLEMVAECAEEGAICKVRTGPLTEDIKKEESEQAAKQGVGWEPLPEGTIDVAAELKERHGARYFPYAKVGGQYRIVAEHYSAAKVAELRAMTVQSITDARLAKGVHEPTEPDNPDWKAKASPLPPRGRRSRRLVCCTHQGDRGRRQSGRCLGPARFIRRSG